MEELFVYSLLCSLGYDENGNLTEMSDANW